MFAPTQSSVPATYPANPLKPNDYLHAQSYRLRLKEWLAVFTVLSYAVSAQNPCFTGKEQGILPFLAAYALF